MVATARLNPGSPWAIRCYPAPDGPGLSLPGPCQVNLWLTTSQNTETSRLQKNRHFTLQCSDNDIYTVQPVGDGLMPKKLTECGKKSCKLCPLIDNSPIDAMITGTTFVPIIQQDVCCEQKNVVYCIRCDECKVIYVGETKRKVKQRISEHLYNIRVKKNMSSLVTHFSECAGKLRVSILAVIHEDGNKCLLQNLEYQWIKTLNCAFPFGLNEHIKGYGIATDIVDPSLYKNSPYLCYPVFRPKRKRGIRKRQNKIVSPHSEWNSFRDLALINPKTQRYRLLHITLRSFNKKSLKNCLESVNKHVPDNEDERELQLAVRALVGALSRKNKCSEINKNKNNRNIKRFFTEYSHVYEAIPLSSLFKHKKFLAMLPYKKDASSFTIGYTFARSISSFVCNHSSFLRSLTRDKLSNLLKASCQCHKSNFKYGPHGHIITGDLKIIQNKRVEMLLKNGAKFRMKVKPNFDKLLKACAEVSDKIVCWFAKEDKLPLEEYQMYKLAINEGFERRVRRFKECENVYYDFRKIKHALSVLQRKYVITVADKAPNNFIFICKKYYALLLCEEMGVTIGARGGITATGNEVYHVVAQNTENIIEMHDKIFAWVQGGIEEENKTLPRLFATPKLHKNPYKFRFIAGARFSTLKKASILLHRLLVFFKKHFVNYCNMVKKRKGVSIMWTINGSNDVYNMYKRLHAYKITKITTADFSTMFTMFEHDIIKDSMVQLINLCFRNAGKKGVNISHSNVWYADQANNHRNTIYLTMQECYKLVTDVIENTYVTFADFVFKQVKGVPMGGNASPMLADLSLAMLEYKFLQNTSNFALAKEFNYTCRYIDDILSINIDGPTIDFLQLAKNIYPVSLELSKTSEINNATFLDASLNITQKHRLHVKVYNKTDDFNFDVVRYTSAESNMSVNIGYNVFFGEMVRFARITNDADNFIVRVKRLLNDFIKKGYRLEKLKLKLKHFTEEYRALLQKFDIFSDCEIQIFMENVFRNRQSAN